jgi:hypothetical protein
LRSGVRWSKNSQPRLISCVRFDFAKHVIALRYADSVFVHSERKDCLRSRQGPLDLVWNRIHGLGCDRCRIADVQHCDSKGACDRNYTGIGGQIGLQVDGVDTNVSQRERFEG